MGGEGRKGGTASHCVLFSLETRRQRRRRWFVPEVKEEVEGQRRKEKEGRSVTQLIKVRVHTGRSGDRTDESGFKEGRPAVDQTPPPSDVVLDPDEEENILLIFSLIDSMRVKCFHALRFRKHFPQTVHCCSSSFQPLSQTPLAPVSLRTPPPPHLLIKTVSRKCRPYVIWGRFYYKRHPSSKTASTGFEVCFFRFGGCVRDIVQSAVTCI